MSAGRGHANSRTRWAAAPGVYGYGHAIADSGLWSAWLLMLTLAVTPGRDAVGEVTLRALIDGKSFTGRGASPDVIDGAVRAYLHALNKAAAAKELEAKALEQSSYLWGV